MLCPTCEIGTLVPWGCGWLACGSCNDLLAPPEEPEPPTCEAPGAYSSAATFHTSQLLTTRVQQYLYE